MHGRLIGCSLLVALAVGCATSAPKSSLASESTPERLRLTSFVDYFANRVERAADEIAQQVHDPSVDRNTVYWKMRVIPMAQRALLRADDQAVVMQLWLLSASMAKLLQGETGAQLGAGQSIAVAAAKEIDQEAGQLAGTLLTPEQFKIAEARIDEFVKGHVRTGGIEFTREEARTWSETMSSILQKPLDLVEAPLTSLNPTSGLSDTAAAVQNFTDEFTQARRQLGYMPSELRWNTQLLLMEIEESVEVSSLTSGVGRIGDSAVSLAETARTLPADISAVVKDLEQQLPAFQATLHEADATITDAGKTAQTLDAMGATWTGMFEAFIRVMATFGLDGDDAAPTAAAATPSASAGTGADTGPPFDINDYGRTAEKLTATAQALSALLADVDGLAQAQEPPPLLLDTEASARAILDRFFLSAATLVLFIALIAFAYRLAITRLTRS